MDTCPLRTEVDIIVAQTPRLNKGVFAGSDAAKVKVCCLDAYVSTAEGADEANAEGRRGLSCSREEMASNGLPT